MMKCPTSVCLQLITTPTASIRVQARSVLELPRNAQRGTVTGSMTPSLAQTTVPLLQTPRQTLEDKPCHTCQEFTTVRKNYNELHDASNWDTSNETCCRGSGHVCNERCCRGCGHVCNETCCRGSGHVCNETGCRDSGHVFNETCCRDTPPAAGTHTTKRAAEKMRASMSNEIRCSETNDKNRQCDCNDKNRGVVLSRRGSFQLT